jgi:hypothetical protein
MTHLNIFTYDSKRLNLHFISSSTFSAFRQQRPCSSYDKRPSLRSRPRIQPCNFCNFLAWPSFIELQRTLLVLPLLYANVRKLHSALTVVVAHTAILLWSTYFPHLSFDTGVALRNSITEFI